MSAFRQAFVNSWNNAFIQTAVDLPNAVKSWDLVATHYSTVRISFDDARFERAWASERISNWLYSAVFGDGYRKFDQKAKGHRMSASRYLSFIDPVAYDDDTLEFVVAFSEQADARKFNRINSEPWAGAKDQFIEMYAGYNGHMKGGEA